MSDFFGPHPSRPDVPEFWRFSEILLQIDGKLEDGKNNREIFEQTISEIAPIQVVEYVALQRALRTVQAIMALAGHVSDPTILAATAWIDGFMVGAYYSSRYRKDLQK